MHGVCRECSGPVTPSITTCEDHDLVDGPICDGCRSPFEVWIDQRCDRCYYGKHPSVELYVVSLVPVIGFLYEHDVDVLDPTFEELATSFRGWFITRVTSDPLRIDVAIEPADDVLTLTLDMEVTVIDADRPLSPPT